MRIERTFDDELIRSIITHPKIYPHVIDDSSPSRENYRPPMHDAVYYLIASDDRPAGAFMFLPVNMITYDLHLAMLPEFWGAKSREALHLAIAWMFHHTLCMKVTAVVPEFNRLVYRLLQDCYFTDEGVSRGSFMKNGKVFNRLILGIEKE